MRTTTCDKCGKEVTPDIKHEYMHLQGINADLGLVEIDLCGECYKRLDGWLMVAPDDTVKVYKKKL